MIFALGTVDKGSLAQYCRPPYNVLFRYSVRSLTFCKYKSSNEVMSSHELLKTYRRVNLKHVLFLLRLQLVEIKKVIRFKVPIVHCEELEDIHADSDFLLNEDHETFLTENQQQEVDKVSRKPLKQQHVNHVPQSVLRNRHIGIPKAQRERNLVLNVVGDFEELSVCYAHRFVLRNVVDWNFFRSTRNRFRMKC